MQILVCVAFAVVAWVGVANAQAPAQLTPTESITYTGTITEVNAPKRIVTTQGPDGLIATWEVPVTVASGADRRSQGRPDTHRDLLGRHLHPPQAGR